MCGILGVRRSLRVDDERFAAALARLGWRGRDASRRLDVGDWTLGVARLAITDRAHDQPILCARTGRAAVLNGALTDAASQWPRFADARTRNDTELLLLRLAADGAFGLASLHGPHAFAIVDPEQDELWLGRDPCGEKPLYAVQERGRVLAFASTLPALRALGWPQPRDDATRAIALRFGALPESPKGATGATVHAVPSGVFRVRGAGGGLVRTPQAPQPSAAAPFREAFAAAVGRCATAEVGLGLALSGGIDSACVAAELARQDRAPRAFQFCARGEPSDERMRARAVAAHCGLELIAVDAGPELLDAAPELAAAAGLPLSDPSVLAVYALARAAARNGVRVLLSGEGADELFLGYPRHRALRTLQFVPRALARTWPAPDPWSMARAARWRRAAAAVDRHAALLEVAPPAFRARVLAPGFADGELPALRSSGWAAVRERELETYLRGDLLPKLDVAMLAAQVEGRCPFLDPAVLACRELALAPQAVLGKRPLRAEFAARLPPGHFAQRKRGFALPLDRWWREDERLAAILLDPRSLGRRWLRADGVRDCVARQRRGELALGHALWLLVAEELAERAAEDSA